MSRQIYNCYISAPAGANLTNLRASLSARGIQVVVPEDFPSGTSWSEELRRTLSRAQLVIGVLTKERQSQWVLYELGQAEALGRQVVLIASPSAGMPPSAMRDLLVLRVSLSNRQAVDFALDQILAAPEPPLQPSAIEKTRMRGLGPQADIFLGQLREALRLSDWKQLEKITAEALRSTGVDVVLEAPNPERGADLVIWSDALDSFIGNPLLVEIKSAIRDLEDAKRAMRQLETALRKSGTRWGLLLYGRGPSDGGRVWPATPPTVLMHSLPDLLEGMRNRSFAEIIRDLRNQRVHGGRS